MAHIAGLILPLFGLIGLGYLAARVNHHPLEGLSWLNIFVLYFALPAMFIRLLSATPMDQLAQIDFAAVCLLATYLVFVIVFSLAYILRRATLAESTIQGLAGCYGNIGYMGPAIALLAFGDTAGAPLALILVFDNTAHFCVAPALMALSGSEKRGFWAITRSIIVRIASHPIILSIIAGIAIAWLAPPIPEALVRLIDYLAQAAAPCALFAMGVTLALRPLKRRPIELTYIVPAKLILHPIITYAVLSLAGDYDDVWIFTAVLLAALPTATNVFVIAQQYNLWMERASATILITTTLSVVSVSVLLVAMQAGWFPADFYPTP